ncbi:hypothetical protein SAMN05444280_1304 [Tangfeifania diversioriginum]|uniref:Uncharacterized protein n=1 Tax=Tangfeifania diversioriginum TaxID=1168035 RepID=A0A1M6M3R8_9BACT|nr:hypothetical protein SAMN05444280_1304 [Tangfeifania diversioriginum]
MAGNVVNIKVCSPLKLRSGLTGNYYAIRHYSYNLPLAVIMTQRNVSKKHLTIKKYRNETINYFRIYHFDWITIM